MREDKDGRVGAFTSPKEAPGGQMTGVDRMKEGRRREIQTFKGNYNEVRMFIS